MEIRLCDDCGRMFRESGYFGDPHAEVVYEVAAGAERGRHSASVFVYCAGCFNAIRTGLIEKKAQVEALVQLKHGEQKQAEEEPGFEPMNPGLSPFINLIPRFTTDELEERGLSPDQFRSEDPPRGQASVQE